MPQAIQLDVLNNWSRMWTGRNYNGRPVDIYFDTGRVVVTHQGNKHEVITAYGRGYGRPETPDRWHRPNWKPGEAYASFRRNGQL